MTGVPLEPLLRRLAETPPSLLRPPRRSGEGEVHADAVVRDVLESLGTLDPQGETRDFLATLAPAGPADARTRQATIIAAWLLADPAFAGPADAPLRGTAFLATVVPEIAGAVEPTLLVTDAERREELVRRALAFWGLVPDGESAATAERRLAALDSAGRTSFLRDAWDRLRRAREVREAMRRKEAEDSAARWGGE